MGGALREAWRPIQELHKLVRPHRGAIVLALVLFAVARGMNLIIPFLSARIIDDVLPSGDRVLLLRLFASVLVVVVFALGFTFAKELVLIRYSGKVIFGLRESIYRALQRLPIGTLRRWAPGYWISRVDGDVNGIVALSGSVVVSLLENVLSAALGAVAIVAVSPRLSLAAFAYCPALVFATLVLSRTLDRVALAGREKWGRYLGVIDESVRNALLVKAFGLEPHTRRRAERRLRAAVRSEISLGVRTRYISSFLHLLSLTLPVVVLWIGIGDILAGELTLGRFVAFNTYLAYLIGPTQALVEGYRSLRVSTVSVDRVTEVLSLEPERSGGRRVGALRRGIELQGVWYTHDGQSFALRDVSLAIPAGTSVAVVGPNGSGKSTLLMILQAYITPARGRLSLDGIDYEQIDLDSLRHLFGFLPDNPGLLSGSLLKNLRIGAIDLPISKLMALLEEMRFFENTGLRDEDLFRPVSDIAKGLSEGQKQLLGVTRVLLRQPEIVVIDEGVSFLDAGNRVRVWELLRTRMAGKTLVVATHDLREAEACDQVIVLEGGQVVAVGTHQAVLELNRWYCESYDRQRQGQSGQASLPLPRSALAG